MTSAPANEAATSAAQPEPGKKVEFPHALVLIFGMIVLAQLVSYVLPAGEFERDGRRVIPGTYERVQAEPLPWHAFASKIPEGLKAAADIIFFVFIIGGALGVVRATGAIDALIGFALRSAGGSRVLLIGSTMGLFVLGSATIGMAEEYLPFMPVLVTLCLALRMDAVVALSIIVVGYGIGFGGATLNPFTVSIAQDIAGLQPTSGQGFRWILLAVLYVVGVHHLLGYARKIEKDPSRSLVADVDYSEGFELPEDTAMTSQRALVLVLFAAAIAFFAYASSAWGWYLTEMSALFFGLALVTGAVAMLKPNRVATEFCNGVAELAAVAVIIGFARTIEVVLSDARVIDTIVNAVAGPLGQLGPAVAAVGMTIFQSVCNLLIPSGSGQAYVTMPLMAPLADVVGVERQVAVLAYQFGDGFTNMIVPTNAVLMGLLLYARIPYQRWIRFLVPLMLKIYAVAIIALFVAVAIGYS